MWQLQKFLFLNFEFLEIFSMKKINIILANPNRHLTRKISKVKYLSETFNRKHHSLFANFACKMNVTYECG